MANPSQRGKTWEAFEAGELLAQRAQSGKRYLEFLNVATINAGVYVLPAAGEDPQPPHEEDELYYFLAGRAVLRIGTEDHPVQPGSIVYVKARVPHRFHSITEELRVLVVFSNASPESPAAH